MIEVWAWGFLGSPGGVAHDAAVFAASLFTCVAACFLVWVVRGGTWVDVPWSADSLPRLSVFAHRCRTRDGSFLSVRQPGYYALLLWKRAPWPSLGMFLADAITCFTGVWAAELDCSLEVGGHPAPAFRRRFAARARGSHPGAGASLPPP
jgi:hypothetical protein